MQGTQLLLLFLLVGSSLAVFFTRDPGSTYPKMGRRSGSYSSSTEIKGSEKTDVSETGMENEKRGNQHEAQSSELFPSLKKRAWYTLGSGNSYPRIGRRSSQSATSRSLTSPQRSSLASYVSGPAADVQFSPRDDDLIELFSKVSKRQRGAPGTLIGIGKRDFSAKSDDKSESSKFDFRRSRRERIEKRLRELKQALGSEVSSTEAREFDRNEDKESDAEYNAEIIFLALDTDGDGSVSRDELRSGLTEYGLTSMSC